MVEPAPQTRHQVLVVDDDEQLLFLACKQLRAAGYDPLSASDGVEALRRMLENPECRQMVTDYTMPAFGGEEWLGFLERFCSDWSIVVMSAADVDPGLFISVPKPARFENIISHLERFER